MTDIDRMASSVGNHWLWGWREQVWYCGWGTPGASVGIYLREAFQSQTHREKILYS